MPTRGGTGQLGVWERGDHRSDAQHADSIRELAGLEVDWSWNGAATGPGETLTGAIWTIYIRTKWNAEFTGKAPYTDVIQVLGQPGFKGCRF